MKTIRLIMPKRLFFLISGAVLLASSLPAIADKNEIPVRQTCDLSHPGANGTFCTLNQVNVVNGILHCAYICKAVTKPEHTAALQSIMDKASKTYATLDVNNPKSIETVNAALKKVSAESTEYAKAHGLKETKVEHTHKLGTAEKVKTSGVEKK